MLTEISGDAKEETDETLMLRYAEGDLIAFEKLYFRHKVSLYRYLRRQVSDDAGCEELFQEVWSKVIQSRTRYKPKAQFNTWLYTIAHNTLVDGYRKGARMPLALTDDMPEPVATNSGPYELEVSAQNAQRLLKALAMLPGDQRDAFLLKHEAGLSMADIAQVMQAGQETVKTRLRYAVSRLRHLLGGAENE